MTDIVERLRNAHPFSRQYALGSMLLAEASDEIETLRQRVKWLESTLDKTIEEDAAKLNALGKELGECQVHFFGYDKLSDELTAERAISDKLEKALKDSRETLQRANDEFPSAIRDTIWHTEHETLFDFMDSAIAEVTAMRKGETE